MVVHSAFCPLVYQGSSVVVCGGENPSPTVPLSRSATGSPPTPSHDSLPELACKATPSKAALQGGSRSHYTLQAAA